MKYEYLEHTADIKFRAYGKNIEEAFTNAAYALTNIMTDNTKVQKKLRRHIKVDAQDEKSMLYDFLETFLVLFDSEEFILAKVEHIKINGNRLSAEVIGDNELADYDIDTHIKAITYQEMEIIKEKDKVTIQVIPDL